MTNALSFYLDGLRFGAAFTVFLAHYSVQRISGGFFWPSFAYGHTAVLVFFVLSGFVIAWVTETRERSLGEYVLSRAARLYSVIIPAFIITAVVNHLGEAVDPQLYAEVRSGVTSHPVLDYALSAVFLGQSWTLDLLPGSNVPFWSLDYEVWYYVIFAVGVFLHGRYRIAALGAAALLAGPKILVLLPVWLMGVAAWRWRASVAEATGSAASHCQPDGVGRARGDGWSAAISAPELPLAAVELHGLRLPYRQPSRSVHRGSRQYRAAHAEFEVRALGPFSRGNNLRALPLALPASELFRGYNSRSAGWSNPPNTGICLHIRNSSCGGVVC